METKELCPRCNRPFDESSDAWMDLAGSNHPELPQKKDYCCNIGEVVHGNALASFEKWESIFLRSEVKRLKEELKTTSQEAWSEGYEYGGHKTEEDGINPYKDDFGTNKDDGND